MDSVEPLVAAVTPFIQDAMASNAVTSIITSCQQPRAALGDNKVIWLIGGIAVGFYFGFRVGVVSGRAKRYVASRRLMRAAALNSYSGVKFLMTGLSVCRESPCRR